MIRILVLCEAFGNAEVDKDALYPPYIEDLEASGKASFTFIDGPVVIDPTLPKYADIAPILPPDPRRWWLYDVPVTADEAPRAHDFHSAAKAVETIREAWRTMGPFDAFLGYSEGAGVMAVLLYEEFLRQRKTADSEILKALKGAVFISTPAPFVGDPPYDPTAVGKSLSADDYGELFDLKTLHIFGSRDTGRRRIRETIRLCNSDKATLFDYGRGHTLPRDPTSIETVKAALTEFVEEISPPEYEVRQVTSSDAPTRMQTERFDLSDGDSMTVSMYIYNYLFFSLDADVDTQRISTAFETGLSETLTQLPIIAGRVFHDESRYPHVLRRTDDKCDLGIRYVDDPALTFKALKSKHFPPAMLARELMFPPGSGPSTDQLYGERFDADGVPCLYMQVNFIKGGLILATAVHHQVADAWSTDMFLGLLADNTRVAMGRREPGPLQPFEAEHDRTPYNRNQKYANEPDQLAAYVRDFLPSVVGQHAAGALDAMAARATPWQEVMGMLVRIPQDKLVEMKREFVPTTDIPYVSAYDCVSSLLGRSITRARLRVGRIQPDDMTTFWHAVNVRGRSSESHKTFFGNAVFITTPDPLPAASFAEDKNLGRMAGAVRRSVRSANAEHLRSWVDCFARTGHDKVVTAIAAFQTTGGLVTSWQQLRLEAFDFGFGPPKAFRSPGVTADGAIILFPTLPGEGVMAWAGSSKECIRAMEADAELLRFAEVLGTERALA